MHFCLYGAISYYQKNNLADRIFLLHGVPLLRSDDQNKLSSIDFYKMGYCSHKFIHPYKFVTLANHTF